MTTRGAGQVSETGEASTPRDAMLTDIQHQVITDLWSARVRVVSLRYVLFNVTGHVHHPER